MRAIIIDDKDARALLENLKLSQFEQVGIRLPEFRNPELWKAAAVAEMHRKFHYVVTRWLQEQGANP